VLQNKLGMSKLPDHLTNPAYFQTLCKPLQQAVVDFPHQAHMVIRRHRLDVNEFDAMIAKTRSNFLFRRNVLQELRDLAQLSEIGEFIYIFHIQWIIRNNAYLLRIFVDEY
jgi:hypothetical protein